MASPLELRCVLGKNPGMPDGPSLDPAIASLGFLLGSWKGKGSGSYPDIDDFEYLEVSTFTHVGKPFLAYTQRTRDATTGQPLHSETGYLRPVDPGRAEFIVAQPSGVVEVHDVEVRDTTLLMRSTSVVLTPTAKQVDAVMRRIEVDRDVMAYRLEMSAMGKPLQHHLTATLARS